MAWRHDREEWIVPIPLGYAALTGELPAAGVVAARDPDTPLYFAESVYGIGQWIAPHSCIMSASCSGTRPRTRTAASPAAATITIIFNHKETALWQLI